MAIDIIARGMIEESYGDISHLSEQIDSHTGNGNIHVTTVDKSKWNGYDAEINKNKSDISALYEITSSGETIDGKSSYTIENAVDYPLIGLNLYGKSVQDGTPTPTAPVDIVSVGDSGSVGVTACGKNLFDYNLLPNTGYNGVTFTNNNNGTFTISGKKDDLSRSFLVISELSHEESIRMFSPGTYTISGLPKEWSWALSGSINLFYNGQKHDNLSNTVNRSTLTITKDMLTDDFCASITIYSVPNSQIIADTFYLQIEKGTVATEFEPYHGATANITSALPLCGIPVESGGNYTDSNGQQWICDELIYNADGSGKVVKRTAVYTMTGNENITFSGSRENSYVYKFTNAFNYKFSKESYVFSNKYTGVDTVNGWSNAVNALNPNEISLFYYPTSTSEYTVFFGSLCTNLSDFKSEVTGTTIVYALAEPQEYELTAAEMSSLRQLQTYNGITNISNDGGADMSVKYCTNKTLSEYVMPITTGLKAQINELKAAVLSLGGNV